MSFDFVGPRALRCIVPHALRGVLVGVIPAQLVRALTLPRNSSFESLDPIWVDVPRGSPDRQLLGELTALADPAIRSRRLDVTGLAFPERVPPNVELKRLPLSTRTRNCLNRESLASTEELRGKSLGRLLEIPAFGVKCLVDLLTAVEGAWWAADADAARTKGLAATPPIELEAQRRGITRERGPREIGGYARRCLVPGALESVFSGTVPPRLVRALKLAPGTPFESVACGRVLVRFAPRLTREARLLADEPWSKHVGVYDARLARHLLTSDDPCSEVQDAYATGRLSQEHPLFNEPPRYDVDLLRCPLNIGNGRSLQWRDEGASPADRSTRETTARPGKFMDADPHQGAGSLPAIVSTAGRRDRRSVTAEWARSSRVPSLRPRDRRASAWTDTFCRT
jgi:RNA polymerase alpha subunit